MYYRNDTNKVFLGNSKVAIGGDAPVTIQSMLNKPAHDIAANVEQAKQLQAAGCEIIRVSVPDYEAVKLVDALKQAVTVPIVADIHFDYKLALESVAAGIDKIRINPGNIGDDAHVKSVADACNAKNIPIRIGVNSGSVEKNILHKYGAPTPEALVESGLYHVSLLEKYNFNNIVLSLKASDVVSMRAAYRLAAEKCKYPLHLGVTEAGTFYAGSIKSAMGIGALLLEGIGNTIRVSLTDDPVTEISAAREILKNAGLRKGGVRFVSCPTCGRTKIDLISLAKQVEQRFKNLNKDITIAVMGCVVNGPGEAREADLGIAGGNQEGIIFKKGEVLKKVPEDRLLDALTEEIAKL